VPPAFSPEFRLIIECLKWPPSDRRTEAIHRAASGSIDWSHLLHLAQRHRVIGLVANGLGQIGTPVPTEIKLLFDERSRALVLLNLSLSAEAVRLLHLFESAGLPVAFLKGSSLSMLAYGNVGLRQSEDIDIIVPPKRFAQASTLLQRAGYDLYEPPPQISPTQLKLLRSMRKDFAYICHETKMKVELHWGLFLNPHFMTMPVWTACREVELSPGIELRTLSDEDLFAFLCAHGSLHWWNRLQWLADIGALLSTASPERIDGLCTAAAARGVGRPASLALLLCRDVLLMNIPERLTPDGNTLAMKWMRRTSLSAMGISTGHRERAVIPLGTTRGSLSALLLRKDWRYRLTELRGLVTCQEDILTVRLPYPLRVLYPFLRLPLWLWRQTLRLAQSTH